MAVDNQNERRGVIRTLGHFLLLILPVADGAIGAADRQMVIGTYPGILAQAPAVTLPLYNYIVINRVFNFIIKNRKFNRVVNSKKRHFTVISRTKG